MALATVTEVKGDVFVKDIAGTITKLKVGDVIESGQIIFGAEESASYKVSFTESAKEQTFVGMAPQLFDITMIPSLAEVEEGAVNHSSANPFAQSILTPEELAALITGDDQKEEIPDETTAGEEKIKDSESTGDAFADRTGAITDVNSDLRKAKFFGVSHDYKQEDVFHREDANRLGTTSAQNQITPTHVTPTPPTSVTPTPPTSVTPIPPTSATPTPPTSATPIPPALAVTTCEDTAYTFRVADFNVVALTSVRIDSLPIDGTLRLDGVAVTQDAVISKADIDAGKFTFHPDANESGRNEYNSTGVGNQKNDYAAFDFTLSDGSKSIMKIDVTPAIDGADLSITTGELTAYNITEISKGYKVTAYDAHGNETTISTVKNTNHDGFGVSGDVDVSGGTGRGDPTEIQYDTVLHQSETLSVKFDNAVETAEIYYAWVRYSETAVMSLYKGGTFIESFEFTHGTDTVDGPFTVTRSDGDVFDELRFTAKGAGDDYIIHSVSYKEVILAESGGEMNLSISTVLKDTDGSESIDKLVISDIPVGMTLSDGTHTFESTTGATSKDIVGWNTDSLKIIVPVGYQGDVYTLKVAVTTKESLAINGSADCPLTQTKEGTFTVTVYEKAIAGNYFVKLESVTADVHEGDTARYKVTIVDVNGVEIVVPTSKNITVNFTYGVDGVGGTADATSGTDYTNTVSTVIAGGTSSTTFDVVTKDDYFAEGMEYYKVSINGITDTNHAFESIASHTIANGASSDIVSAIGTIIDNPSSTKEPIVPSAPDGTTYDAEDSVYVKITNNASTIEGGNLTHTVTLVDKNGANVTVPAGETITVTLTYNPDATVDGDFTAPKTTMVTISGGNSSATITNTTIDDFTAEGIENYTVTITDVAQSNGTYENIAIHPTLNSATGEIIDGVTLGNPTDAYVDEDNFDITNPSITLQDTQSLNITAPNGDNGYTLSFDGTPTFTSGNAGYTVLTSNGTVIEYVVSGNTTTAYDGAGRTAADRVFVITLNKNGVGGADDNYTYTQYKNIDHPLAGDDDVVLTFGYKITDGTATSGVENFTVTVSDSVPSSANQSIETNEDTSKIIVISDESFAGGSITLNNGNGDQMIASGGSISIYDSEKDDIVGSLTNNGNGTLTFTPVGDYSGETNGFTYSVSDNDGDSATGAVGISVKPIADAPSIIKADVTTTEDNNNTAEGTNSVALGLTLPSLSSDQTDKNSVHGTQAGDHPERLGYIELKFTNGTNVNGAILEKGDGTDLATITTNNQIIKIYITDVTGYHYSGLNPVADSAIQMSQAEYEALKIIHAEDNDRDINISISTTSYEVDDAGIPLSTTNTDLYETATATMSVNVTAKTDDISLAWNNTNDAFGVRGTHNGSAFTFDVFVEENLSAKVIDLQALLTQTSGYENDATGDLDGSERRSYTFSDIPEGTIINLGGTTAIADSSGTATVNFSTASNSLSDPTFTMTLPEHYGGVINGTITLSVYDQDVDTNAHDAVKTAQVTFTMDVTQQADPVTLQVAQATGDEDAGRTAGNTANDGSASVIDAPANGIPLMIKTTSADTDGSETFTVTIDGVPDGGSLYVYDMSNTSWKLVNEGTASSGNITITNNGDTTWKVTIADYQNDHLTKFIPPHNSDDNYMFTVSATTVDGLSTLPVTQPLQIQVDVKEVADSPINDTLATVNVNGHTFNATNTEDNATRVNLKNIFATPGTLGSYDADGSETLSIKVTNLASGFDIQGATFLGGSGTGRIWFVDIAKLNAGDVTLTTPLHFAGESNFDIRLVTTEDAGDSKTHEVKNVSVMITPIAEAGASINSSDTQDEDTPKVLNFGFSSPDTDGAAAGQETLQSFSIDVTELQAAGITLVSNGVDLTTGKTGYQNVTVTAGTLEAVTATLPQDSDADYSFNISYTYLDTALDGDGNLYTHSVTKTDQLYSVTVNPITDDVALASSTTTTAANSVDGSGNVTVTNNGIFTKVLTLTGIDSDGRGSADTDSSEQFTRITVSGVPEGITVVGGSYAGDTGGGNYSGFWYVNIADQALDGDGATYNLVFDVDGSFSIDQVNTPFNITMTAFNEDGNNNVEQSDSVSFNLTIANTITGPGPGIPAVITAFYQDIDNDATHDHSYTVSSVSNTTITDANAYTGSVLREDTPFQLSDVIHVGTDGVNSAFSITIRNVPIGVTIEGMTYNAGGDFYTISGNGNQQSIVNALNAITVTPIANQNTSATNISGTDLAFDVELTTYATGGASHTALINFTGSLLPVTDDMALSVVNDGVTTEDTDQVFSITLDNPSDGVNTVIIDGKVYLKITESYTDAQGSDGTHGTLKDGNGIAITTTQVNPAGLPAGTYYVIDGATYNQTLNFIYTPAENRNGSVSVDVLVKNKEAESWNPYDTAENVSTKTLTFDVNAVTDGFVLGSSVDRSGNEDTLTLLDIALTNIDSSETLTSVSLNKIPDGFLVFFGANADGSGKVMAQNLGANGTMSMEMRYGTPETVVANLWNIPLSGGTLPAYVWIQGPQNWSGTIEGITVQVLDQFGNTSSNTMNVVVDPTVDTLTLNTTQTFGNAGEDIELKINANIQDLDGSETATLTLTGLGEGASFKANGVWIDEAHITYVGDTYTISDIAAADINAITFIQSAMSANVSVSAKMVESDGSESATLNGADFHVTIGAAAPTSGNDTLLYSGSAIDGGAGIDTVIFKNIDTINLSGISNITNIEKMDMSGNGNQTLSGLSLQQIFDMSGSGGNARTLTIDGDSGDALSTVTKTGWTKNSEETAGGYTSYTYHNDATPANTLTLKVDTDLTNTTNLH
jgi:trimeric autotransporter adhesin